MFLTQLKIEKPRSLPKTFELQVDLIDQIRSNYDFDKSKQLKTRVYSRLYRRTMLTALDLYRETQNKGYLKRAYFAVQAGKANILNDKLNASNIENFGEIPSDLIKSKHNKKSNIVRIKEKVNRERLLPLDLQDGDMIKLLSDSILYLEKDYSTVVDKIKSNFPKYDNLISPNRPSLDEVQKDYLLDNQA